MAYMAARYLNKFIFFDVESHSFLTMANFSDTLILSALKDPQFGARFTTIYLS